MYGQPGTHKRGTTGCGACLCLAFFLMLFATVSPYWLWARYFHYGTSARFTAATGSYVISSSSSSWYCGWWTTCVVSSQWNYIDDFNNTICETEFYDQIGKYGFCSGENGQVQIPSKISAIQGLTVATTVFVFFASIFAITAPGPGGSKMAYLAGLCCFVSAVLSCTTFSLAVSYDWYQSFGSTEGGVLPFISSGGCDTPTCLFLSEPQVLYWGPAFWTTVLVFVITLLATCSICGVAKSMDASDDLDYGAYGTGSNINGDNAGYTYEPYSDVTKA